MSFVPTEKVVLNNAREEVSWRLKNRIASVRSVPERQAVTEVRKRIVEARKFPAGSDKLKDHFKDMADVLAGPFPALARVDAASAVGEAIAKDNLLVQHPDFLRILEGMQTAPDYREGPIEHGAWLHAMGKAPDFLNEKLTDAVGHGNQNDARRLALSMAAMEIFQELNGAFIDMDLPEWTRLYSDVSFSGDDSASGEMRPKCVIKMGKREVQADDRGIVEFGTRLPTRQSMATVAHLGVPVHGRFNIGGESDPRNLSILLAEPKSATNRVEPEEDQASLQKWRGIRMSSFDMPPADSLAEMKEALDTTGNCLFPQVLKLAPADALTWNLALRVSRDVYKEGSTQTERRQVLPKVLSRHLARITQPVTLEKWRDREKIGEQTTTILAAHVKEFNERGSGWLEGKKITEEVALDVLETTVTAALCTKEPNGVLDIVRGEPELVMVLEMLMKLRISDSDKKRFKSLVGPAGSMRAETVRREKTPLEKLPEMIKD